jgi:PAS domain-containing protein
MKLTHKNDESPEYLEKIDIDQDVISREFKRTSDELRLLEEKFYKIFELNPYPMAIDELQNNTIIDVNQAYLGVFGIKDKSEVIGKDTTESGLNIFKGKDKKEYIDTIKRNGYVKNFAARVRPLKGRKFTGMFSGTIIELDKKKYLLSICVVVKKKKLFNFIFF